MALIIEDGTIVVGANSFVTVDEAIEYAELRKLTFPEDEEEVEALLLDAMDYIFTYRTLFSGTLVDPEQEQLYPRADSYVNGMAIADNVIPKQLKLAQMQLAVDSYEIGGLMQSTNGYAVAKEKIDVIEIEYAAGGRLSGNSPPATPSFPKADAWLDSLCESFGSYLTTVRV